jgi:hypothetical protein
MRPPTQRPRWRCLDPGCPAHTWQWIPDHVDPLHGGRDAIAAHRLVVHGDDGTLAVLETEEARRG